MQDENNPNLAMPQASVADMGLNPINPVSQAPAEDANPVISPQVTNEGVVTPPVDVSPQVPQSQDKSDAITYPLGSQDTQPGAELNIPTSKEDHRTILDRIMGMFNKGKKDQPEKAQPASVDQAPTNTTPPLGQ